MKMTRHNPSTYRKESLKNFSYGGAERGEITLRKGSYEVFDESSYDDFTNQDIAALDGAKYSKESFKKQRSINK